MMTQSTARAIARIAHEGQQTSAGGSLFDHLQRVAAAVPEYARVTAWLHDALERTDLTIVELRARGMSPVELGALALLTRAEHADYRSYVHRIADAPGQRGTLARVVKLADLDDHLAHRHLSSSTPPYAWARHTILLTDASLLQMREGGTEVAPTSPAAGRPANPAPPTGRCGS